MDNVFLVIVDCAHVLACRAYSLTAFPNTDAMDYNTVDYRNDGERIDYREWVHKSVPKLYDEPCAERYYA